MPRSIVNNNPKIKNQESVGTCHPRIDKCFCKNLTKFVKFVLELK